MSHALVAFVGRNGYLASRCMGARPEGRMLTAKGATERFFGMSHASVT